MKGGERKKGEVCGGGQRKVALNKAENPKKASLCKTAAVTPEETRGDVVLLSSKGILRDFSRWVWREQEFSLKWAHFRSLQ